MIRAVSYLKNTLKAAAAICIALLIFCSGGGAVYAFFANALPSNESAGGSYMVYECDTKQTLLKQNTELSADCTLLARLMTCLLVLENPSISVTD